jgi:hypothetical protein
MRRALGQRSPSHLCRERQLPRVAQALPEPDVRDGVVACESSWETRFTPSVFQGAVGGVFRVHAAVSLHEPAARMTCMSGTGSGTSSVRAGYVIDKRSLIYAPPAPSRC